MKRAIDILLVESDPVHAALIAEGIGAVAPSCHVQRVEEPEQARGYLQGNGPAHETRRRLNPALVILELLDPRKPQAAEFLRWLRSHPRTRHLPVIVLGVVGDVTSVTAAYDLGATSYLVKPKDHKRFLDMITVAATYWTAFNQPPE